ncbi:MAG: ACP S-malonyltransferase [Parachlamydiales bacterium]|nr:ACP S-malonyltransferase [Parachlamydiales bacterium]
MKIALLFPGQGAQHVGMAKDFYTNFSVAKNIFEEASDIVHFPLSKLIFDGPESDLKMTKNAQIAIFVTSLAILGVIEKEFPSFTPFCAAGLSLGEYSALCAADYLEFSSCLPLVHLRAKLMHDACEKHKGMMVAVIGLSAEEVERWIHPLHNKGVWAANFNAPSQVVISGTKEGVSLASLLLKEKGARAVIPLKVHGAFHSGLMEEAAQGLKPHIEEALLQQGNCPLVMNILGDFVEQTDLIKKALIQQVTGSVYWEKSVKNMLAKGVECFLEMGPGKTLTGLNQKIEGQAPSYSIQNVENLQVIDQLLGGSTNVTS